MRVEERVRIWWDNSALQWPHHSQVLPGMVIEETKKGLNPMDSSSSQDLPEEKKLMVSSLSVSSLILRQCKHQFRGRPTSRYHSLLGHSVLVRLPHTWILGDA